MDQLRQLVTTLTQPSEAEWNYFASLLHQESFDKHHSFIKAGKPCNRMYFINSGIVCYHMVHNEKQKPIALAMDNDLVTDFFSFYSGLPAIVTAQSLKQTDVLFIEKSDLEMLYRSSATWERFGRLIAQQGLLEQVMEKLDLQTKTAEQRYLELIARKPNLLEEVNLGVIASCLNITPETLSRIRARI